MKAQQQQKTALQRQTVNHEAVAQMEASPLTGAGAQLYQLPGLPTHPTSRTIRQMAILRMQQQQGNASVQRMLASASRGNGRSYNEPLAEKDNDESSELIGSGLLTLAPVPPLSNGKGKTHSANGTPTIQREKEGSDTDNSPETGGYSPKVPEEAAPVIAGIETTPTETTTASTVSPAEPPAFAFHLPNVGTGGGSLAPIPSTPTGDSHANTSMPLVTPEPVNTISPNETTTETERSVPVARVEPRVDAGTLSPEYQVFLQQVKSIRKGLTQTTTNRKKRITDGAGAEKQKIEQLVEAEAVRLEGIYDNTLKAVRSNLTSARTEIETGKTAKVESTRTIAQTELNRLDTVEREKKEAMQRVAKEKANAATAMGEREAQRAIDGSRSSAKRAQHVKQEKIAQLRNVKNGERLTSDVERRVADLAHEFTKAGGDLAAMARRRAGEAADHIKAESTELVIKMGQPTTDARTEIIRCRDETIKSIQDQAQTSLTNLQKEADDIITNLQSDRRAKCAQVRANTAAISHAVGESVTRAHHKVDGETARIDEEITRFVNKISEVSWAGPQLESAGSDLAKAVTEHDTEQDSFATDVITGVRTGITNAVSNLGEVVTNQGKTVTTIGTDFETEVSKASAKVIEKMEDARKEGAEKITEPVKQVEEKLERGVDRAAKEWDRQIKVVENDISHDINDGLRKQGDAVAALSSSLDNIGSRARSFVSSIVEGIVNFGSFIAGVVVGMLEHVWDLLKDLWELIKKPLFWIAVAIVAVVVIIVIIFFGWEALVAALAVIGKVLLVVGIIIGIGVAVYYIYLAITKPDLSPYERGKLVGKAIDEIILAFLGTGVWSKLGGWIARVSRIAAFLDKIGDIVKAARLLRRVRDIEVAIRLMDEIKDAEVVLRLLEEIDDVENVLKLWRAVGSADDILKLWAEIKDAENIVKLWTEVKNADTILRLWADIKDAEKIIKLWATVKDADAILKLWAKSKDVDLIVKLWGKLADADKLIELLDKVKDGEILFRLLEKVTDVGQLERLLSQVDKVADLEKLLQHMSPQEIEDFITALGDINLFKQLATKYGGDALKFYGAKFFKEFKGVTSHTETHLLSGHGIKGAVVSGCHDKAAFEALEASGQIIIDRSLTRASGLFVEYTYQVVGKTKTGVKTVVDGLAVNWPSWETKIIDAIDNLIKSKTFPIPDNSPIPPTPLEGATWTGWFSSGGTKEISTFFPTI